MAGFSPGEVEQLQTALGNDALISSLSVDDTVSPQMVGNADVILIDGAAGEGLAHRLGRHIEDTGSDARIFLVGNDDPSPLLRSMIPQMRHVAHPVDLAYLRGVLDSIQLDSLRFKRLDEEQSRVRGLYEISSALLKVSNRMHIAPTLDATLTHLIEARLIILVFPADPHPLIYLHSPKGLSPRVIETLTYHLQEAWEILRADLNVSWSWLASLSGHSEQEWAPEVTSSSYMTTPISSGAQTRGFLTVLPNSDDQLNETFLQTFFVIGDLISVLIHNLELRESLEDRAMHDGLTRVFNRQTVIEQLEKECRRSQRYGHVLSIVMFDLDHFKEINDRYGHQAGDEVLRVIGYRLRMSIREMDMAGRFGGEEFIVVLVNTDMEGACHWAERFRTELHTKPVPWIENDIPITASFGVASLPGEKVTSNDLIALADNALYRAKRTGRNAVATADDAPAEQQAT